VPHHQRGLKGSALFAAAAFGVAAGVTPAFAQDPAAKPAEEQKKPEGEAAKEQPKPADGPTAEKKDPNKLYDKAGVEYRVCERCGGNMYKEEKTWTCEQCGLSYTE
jgi:hypothetical protein